MPEKMISLGKAKDLAAYHLALAFITREDIAKKIFDEIAPKYAQRNGGYTRIIRLGARCGDAAKLPSSSSSNHYAKSDLPLLER